MAVATYKIALPQRARLKLSCFLYRQRRAATYQHRPAVTERRAICHIGTFPTRMICELMTGTPQPPSPISFAAGAKAVRFQSGPGGNDHAAFTARTHAIMSAYLQTP